MTFKRIDDNATKPNYAWTSAHNRRLAQNQSENASNRMPHFTWAKPDGKEAHFGTASGSVHARTIQYRFWLSPQAETARVQVRFKLQYANATITASIEDRTSAPVSVSPGFPLVFQTVDIEVPVSGLTLRGALQTLVVTFQSERGSLKFTTNIIQIQQQHLFCLNSPTSTPTTGATYYEMTAPPLDVDSRDVASYYVGEVVAGPSPAVNLGAYTIDYVAKAWPWVSTSQGWPAAGENKVAVRFYLAAKWWVSAVSVTLTDGSGAPVFGVMSETDSSSGQIARGSTVRQVDDAQAGIMSSRGIQIGGVLSVETLPGAWGLVRTMSGATDIARALWTWQGECSVVVLSMIVLPLTTEDAGVEVELSFDFENLTNTDSATATHTFTLQPFAQADTGDHILGQSVLRYSLAASRSGTWTQPDVGWSNDIPQLVQARVELPSAFVATATDGDVMRLVVNTDTPIYVHTATIMRKR